MDTFRARFGRDANRIVVPKILLVSGRAYGARFAHSRIAARSAE
jgi:hypothetical protein